MFDAGDFTARGPDQGTHVADAQRGDDQARAQEASAAQPVPPVPSATCAWTAPSCELPRHRGSRLCWGHGGDTAQDPDLARFDATRRDDTTLSALAAAERRLGDAIEARLTHLWLAQQGDRAGAARALARCSELVTEAVADTVRPGPLADLLDGYDPTTEGT